MKSTTVLATLAAFLPATMAAPTCLPSDGDSRFPTTGPFNGIILAYDYPKIHYSYLEADGGLFFLNIDSNSSCGAIHPVLNGGQGSLSTYNTDDNAAQQVFLDISGAAGGLLSYTGPLWQRLPETSVHDFDRVAGDTITTLLYHNQTWLACPDLSSSRYYVYAAAAYDKQSGSESCMPFEIRTDAVANPQSCIYY